MKKHIHNFVLIDVALGDDGEECAIYKCASCGGRRILWEWPEGHKIGPPKMAEFRYEAQDTRNLLKGVLSALICLGVLASMLAIGARAITGQWWPY